MTKLLSRLLDAQQPQFSQALTQLEAASGNGCQDIRLSESVIAGCRAKISALGLDPEDTTGEELYLTLQQRLIDDDAMLIKRLRQISAYNVNAAGNLSEGMVEAIRQSSHSNKVFVLKASIAKQLLMTNAPKKTMRLLGYRSLGSLLKHEPLSLVVLTARTIEPLNWQHRYDAQLKQLIPAQFEERAISIASPHNDKWSEVCSQLLASSKKTVIVNKELGAIVIIPLPNRPNPGITTVTLALAADGLNGIQAASSYLRLSQVAGDFGRRVDLVATDDPLLTKTEYFNAPLSWETVQRFIHHTKEQVDVSLGEHLGVEELLGWQPVESLIHWIAPEMKFWKDGGHLAAIDNGQTIPFNILDNALSLVNRRSYKEHYLHHFRRSLWQEFIARYIRPELLRTAISNELVPELAGEASLD
ncbi:hypothetical protein M1512_04480 [Patescibacteria group bacterium]|nr:hypothetical protein [Patescibacteria group bacterium]